MLGPSRRAPARLALPPGREPAPGWSRNARPGKRIPAAPSNVTASGAAFQLERTPLLAGGKIIRPAGRSNLPPAPGRPVFANKTAPHLLSAALWPGVRRTR